MAELLLVAIVQEHVQLQGIIDHKGKAADALFLAATANVVW